MGCGKTTLIRRLLETEYKGKKVAIIENEIGKVNLDRLLLQESGITIREITGGCVCCTIQGEFNKAIENLTEEIHPDFIIIEPTGAADLTGILEACQKLTNARIRRIVTILNAKKAIALLKVVGEFYKEQIQLANCIYLNFTEKMQEDELKKTMGVIEELHPGIHMIRTPLASVTESTFPQSTDPIRNIKSVKLSDGFKIKEMGISEKKPLLIRGKKNKKDLYTYTLQIPNPLSASAYKTLKNLLSDQSHLNLWRIKGWISLESGQCKKIDGSFGDIFEENISSNLLQQKINTKSGGEIVLIGPYIDQAWLDMLVQELSKLN